jgi:uncharacterized protein
MAALRSLSAAREYGEHSATLTSGMRAIPDEFDPSVVASIGKRLADVRREHGVAVPWAIESGSRAWGFPSPDSDYDCRFIFVRPRAAYVDPWPARDVIETPLDAVLDVNGWDLVKAVRLAVKGNATVAEWLRSPFAYDGDQDFRDGLLELFDAVADRGRIGRHYLHVGRDHWEQSGAGSGEDVALKRVFYAVRPAAVLRWLAGHPDQASPPMNLRDLLDQAPPPDDVREAIDALVEAKATTRELGSGRVVAPLIAWVSATFEAGEAAYPTEGEAVPEARELGRRMFRSMVDRWAPDPGLPSPS